MSEYQKQDYVVLLHGLGRDPRIMRPLEHYLTKKGYTVYNAQYASTQHSIESLVQSVYENILRECPDTSRRLHFVGHSLGGIIIRFLIEQFHPANLGRVVMIAPPNKGSEVVDFLKRYSLYQRLFGPVGQQLGTQQDSIVTRLHPIDYELGIIAGSRTLDPWFSWFLLPGPSDGKVTIESTKLEGMKDHIVLPASHYFIPKKRSTLYQVNYFLKHGVFDHY